MSILDKLRAVDTHNLRPWNFNATPLVDTSVKETDRIIGGGISAAHEFKLIGTIEITFAANTAQYQEALKNAEKMLLIRLYGDFLPIIKDCRRAVFAGDPHQALEALSKMETEIGI